jgi:hypothetical protein
MSAADDHRPVQELWMVSVDVGESEFGELWVLEKTRRSALAAAPLGRRFGG